MTIVILTTASGTNTKVLDIIYTCFTVVLLAIVRIPEAAIKLCKVTAAAESDVGG